MAFSLNSESLYVKGTADIWVFNASTGDLDGYSNKLDTSNLTSSTNNGEIRAGLGAPVAINLPDSSTFTGTITAQDFSLEARQLQTGGTISYNAAAIYRETVTATTAGQLTVSKTPVAAYGESSSSSKYACYVGTDGRNYGVNSKGIVYYEDAVVGESYCVMYFTQMVTAKQLTIPTTFSPAIERVMIRMAVYSANGSSANSSSFAGYLYVHIPRAQFVGGDAGVNGSQTENATTAWTFSALSYSDESASCVECARENSVLGYMVYVPCNGTLNIDSVVITGSPISLTVGDTYQTPVYYVVNSNLVTADYSAFTYTSATTSTATVSSTGLITAKAAGTSYVTATYKDDTSLVGTAQVVVTAAS